MSFYYYDYYSKPSVAEQKAEIKHKLESLLKKNPDYKPVNYTGRTIGQSFWGRSWCKQIESFADYNYRLERGRSYLRMGAIANIKISSGLVEAVVIGSRKKPYNVEISIDTLSKKKWEKIKSKCTGQISSLLSLINGELSSEIIEILCDRENGLFPTSKEIKFDCTCPDYAGCCKHIASVLYAIAVKFDEDPKLFFKLRNVDEKELLGSVVIDKITENADSEIENVEDVFGITFDEVEEPVIKQPRAISQIPYLRKVIESMQKNLKKIISKKKR